ncbi:unnamed protein product [Closterium sp. NIES-64]|nr:unnamed protein product [Closterium sp. NIES-64]
MQGNSAEQGRRTGQGSHVRVGQGSRACRAIARSRTWQPRVQSNSAGAGQAHGEGFTRANSGVQSRVQGTCARQVWASGLRSVRAAVQGSRGLQGVRDAWRTGCRARVGSAGAGRAHLGARARAEQPAASRQREARRAARSEQGSARRAGQRTASRAARCEQAARNEKGSAR